MDERKPSYPVLDIIINRCSRRAMSGEPIAQKELMSLFEAARWAPSSHNHQPWRFIYAHRDTPEWERLFNLLEASNQVWAKNAAVLIVAISHHYFEYNDTYSRTHSLDTGAATENLALQGHSMGLVVHGIEGFDYDKAKEMLSIPDDYTIEAMYAIGKQGLVDSLPSTLQEREKYSQRLPVEKLIFKGIFGGKID